MADTVLQAIVEIPDGSHFGIQNIPFGVFCHPMSDSNHCATRIGDYAVDLHELASRGLLNGSNLGNGECFLEPTLNAFMALGRPAWIEARSILQSLLGSSGSSPLMQDDVRGAVLFPVNEVQMVMPAKIGDYTDFYSSLWHATNVGKLFRPNEAALKPNWLHLPVGYHGRASSVVVSGTPIRRPMGQVKPADSDPVWKACGAFDFEVEMAFFFGGTPNEMGQRIPVERAHENIFGVVVMNDWSARDIQKWEYVPLGPFNGKNFATTISPWIVTMEALEPYRCPAMTQDRDGKVPLPYLQDPDLHSYDINLSVSITPENGEEEMIGETNTQSLYWTFTQQLAHHASTGCPFRVGDLCGTGTISGQTVGSYGSMLEISKGFKEPVTLKDGSTRRHLTDGDNTIMRAWCVKDGEMIGFGECEGLLLPADQ